MSAKLLQQFAEAFNRHDLDALMGMMTDDCVFRTAAGAGATGVEHRGQEAVRRAFAGIFAAFPDSSWDEARHFVDGERGASQWTYRATAADGSRIEVAGCDLFTLRGGRIAVKDSYRKQRTG